MKTLIAARQLAPWLHADMEQLLGQGNLGHGLLVHGPAGVGKLNFALVLSARLLGIEGSRQPLGPGDALGLIDLDDDDPRIFHPDLCWLRPTRRGGRIGVDAVRATIADLTLTSHAGGPKVAVIEPAESMTLAAANALLKTLEEPTRLTYLLLVSDRPGMLPATVRSRCRRVALGSVGEDQAVAWLQQWGSVDDTAWRQLLLRSHGGPMQALRLASRDFINLNMELSEELEAVSQSKQGPLDVATRWSKSDPDLRLEWLVGSLEEAIKEVHRASNRVTDLPGSRLHNVLAAMTLPTLFDALDEARALLGSLGGGINVEMAMRSLLMRFAPDEPL